MLTELERLHDLFNTLGVAEGQAYMRLESWYHRRVGLLQANGHLDSCQCMFCSEYRLIKRLNLVAQRAIDEAVQEAKKVPGVDSE